MEDIKQIKSSLKELETERDDIQLRCIKAELELSIENILARLEQLEKENKFWKEYKEKLDKLDTKDFIFKHELENYIPKSVIREKIEELEKIKLSMTYSDKYFDASIQGGIDTLKELLGEEK